MYIEVHVFRFALHLRTDIFSNASNYLFTTVTSCIFLPKVGVQKKTHKPQVYRPGEHPLDSKNLSNMKFKFVQEETRGADYRQVKDKRFLSCFMTFILFCAKYIVFFSLWNIWNLLYVMFTCIKRKFITITQTYPNVGVATILAYYKDCQQGQLGL